MTEQDALLSISDLTVRYGPITAVRGVSCHVCQREIVAIVGPNGAGKTSLLSAVAGIVRPASGSISFAGSALDKLRLEDVVRAGVALVPEGRHVFSRLTVEENLRLGTAARTDIPAIRQDMDRILGTFPILAQRRTQPAGQLSGGEQQQLVIARALLSRPKLLMLDEPSLGLAPRIVDQVFALLGAIRDDGVSILLVEQNAVRAFALADRIQVMSGGAVTLAGTPAELAPDKAFDAAYFGLSRGAVAG